MGAYFIHASSAASIATVTVTNTDAGSLQTQLSTNNVWAFLMNDGPSTKAKFNALHAPLVRIHASDDGGFPSLPELVKNQWDFTNMNELVNNVFDSGQAPLMNTKFPPDWQWTCTTLYTAGTVRDQTFQEYAQYLARLVDYYNNGSMTTEQGQAITNPVGTSHRIVYWEPWNEPDLNNETPCAPPSGVGLTPAQYLTMWNAVTVAMLAKDPGLKFVGPATAGSQFGSSPATGNQYVDDLMAGATIKPSALSFHGYGYWDNTVTDKWIFDGDNTEPATECCGGISDIVHGINTIRAAYPTVPIWLTEINVNADWGNDTHERPSSEFAAAWWGALFQQTAPIGAGMIHQYNAIDGPQFGLIDDQTSRPYIAYYVFQLLNASFPQGSTILSSSSNVGDVLSLAVRKPDGNISIMLVNRQLASTSVKSTCGTGGVPVTVTLNLSGITPTAITRQQIDKNNVNCTNQAGIAPTVQSVDITQPITATFPGYGVAVFDVTTGSAPADTTPPILSAVTSGNITASGATITWTTNEIADSQVEYGTTTAYGTTTTLNSSLLTSHSQAVTGLTASTLYHYRVKSKDAAGNLVTGSDATFTTAATPPVDTTPPILSAVTAGSIITTGATITWTTNEVADSQVEYGVTSSYGTSTTLNSSMVTTHSVLVSGLTAGTPYHYRVKSKDPSTNLVTGSDATFTTSALPADTTPPNTTITANPAASTTSTSASFSFSATESGSTFQCKLDSGSYAGCVTPVTYNGLSVASHTFSVRATDIALNTDLTPASFTWAITAPPTPPPPSPTPAPGKTGDLNGDNAVNLQDLSILLSRYNSTNAQADINKDGRVDLKDLSVLLSKYGS